jgi:hypothetical protein
VSELRKRQALLVKCLGELIQYATSQGHELTLGEAYIQTPRKTRAGRIVDDGVHMPSSLHYRRLAIDLNLFVRKSGGSWEYITDSQDPVWYDLGTFWETLDPLCRWGGRFDDANHVSIAYGGRA